MGADCLVPKEVAAELGISVKTVLRMIAAHVLPAVDFGRGQVPRWRVARADLAAFLASRRSGPGVPRDTIRTREDKIGH